MKKLNYHVPVVDSNGNPLMPTILPRAMRWVKTRKATPFYKLGIWCVRLNIEPSARNVQPVALGIDPGSKKEGYTVKSCAKTYLNMQCDAVTWVKKAVETRRNARRNRRYRKTPCRANRLNRKQGGLSPSTKARWQLKLRLIKVLDLLYPVTNIVVEDIKAETKKNCDKWNKSFSPLQVGKKWFYSEVGHRLSKVAGYETKELRDRCGLRKSKDKISEDFSAHCVDSWAMANSVVSGHAKPDLTKVNCIRPLQFHRRQLHVFNMVKGGVRKLYGSTRSMGFKRGSLVKHVKYGLVYIGGTSSGQISLHCLEGGKQLTHRAKVGDCRFVAYNSFRCF